MASARFSLAAALAFLALGGCSKAVPLPVAPPCTDAIVPGTPFGTRCGQLVDAAGRVVVLRGVNARVAGVFDVTFDDGRTPLEPIPTFDATDPPAMRSWGFDALRLPINWSALEPKDGAGFDEAYLDRVAAVVDLARAAGIVVLVDLHQDAYSKEIGEDGAPLWAIEPPPPMLLQGPLTDLGTRRLSAPVVAAFNSFFGTADVGTQLRSRFAAMAAHVAARFANDTAVMGIEIFNEPVSDDAGLRRLDAAALPLVRSAAPTKLYLFEPPATRNLFDYATVGSGSLGPLTVYAPHVYTDAFSSNAGNMAFSKDLLVTSNTNARDEAAGYLAPLVITEWGFDPSLPNAADYVRYEQESQDDAMASSFFWVWKETSQGHWGCFDADPSTGALTERAAFKRAIAHVRPSRIAGFPRSFSYDAASGHFAMKFYADPTVLAPHEIMVPSVLGAPKAMTCDGKTVAPLGIDGTVVRVVCGDGDGRDHVLTLDVSPPA